MYPEIDKKKGEVIRARVDNELYNFVLEQSRESNRSEFIRKLILEKKKEAEDKEGTNDKNRR